MTNPASKRTERAQDTLDDFWDHFPCEGLCGTIITLRIHEWGKYTGIFNRHVFAELKRERPDLVYCEKCFTSAFLETLTTLRRAVGPQGRG